MTETPQPQAPMDGVSGPSQSMPVAPVASKPTGDTLERGAKQLALFLRLIIGVAYAAFVCWELFLLLLLPSPTGESTPLQSMGFLSSLGGVLVLFAFGWLAVMRIARSGAPVSLKQRSMVLLVLLLLPGIALGATTPYFITREPPIGVQITSPTSADAFVAPVSVTFSLETAVTTLKNLGYRPVKYQWDGEGDGKMDQETVTPTFTKIYQKQGVYIMNADVVFDTGMRRRLQRRVSVPRAVFAVIPQQPVIEKTARFSIGDLLPDPKQLKQITWDFGDGIKPVVSKTPDSAHTYYATGQYEVTATVQLITNAEQVLKRTIDVIEPLPLPFPITLTSQPTNLMGPSPFGAIFSLETEEQLREVEWDFGDGKVERGANLMRMGHTFDGVGVYPVVVRARNLSGSLAELTQVVRVTETLTLSDLRFDGTPAVQGDKIQGELPLEVTLTPKTTTPLVTFFWESDDEGVDVQDTTLRAVYREQGTYTVTLVAQDADGRAMRKTLTIDVKPASAEPSIAAVPENGVAPLSVQFDASESYIPPEETLAGFKWTFGDEQRNSDAELGPSRVTHTYKAPGEYRVILRVVTVSGNEYSAERTIVVRRPPLDACITTSRTRVQAGKGVEFDSTCSTGVASSFVWDVRSDANPKVVLAQSPTAKYIYVFELPGTYTVSLALRDAWGNEDTASVTITVTP